MKNIYFIGKGEITLDDLKWIITENIKVELASEAKERIQKCRDYLDKKMENQTGPIYGITTGFGSLYNRTISNDDLSTLQENLVKSHVAAWVKRCHR